jgi:hypothetical protein
MRRGAVWSIAVSAVLSTALCGCNSTATSNKSVAGIRMPSLLGKSEDASLRKAVEQDPFPRAQGVLAAKSSTP